MEESEGDSLGLTPPNGDEPGFHSAIRVEIPKGGRAGPTSHHRSLTSLSLPTLLTPESSPASSTAPSTAPPRRRPCSSTRVPPVSHLDRSGWRQTLGLEASQRARASR